MLRFEFGNTVMTRPVVIELDDFGVEIQFFCESDYIFDMKINYFCEG